MRGKALISLVILAAAAPAARAQSYLCEDQYKLDDSAMAAYRQGPLPAPVPEPDDPFKLRVLRYATLSAKHRLAGLASYYSRSLEGTLTANGERYHHHKMTAAHLTLPLGTWVELKARATGKTLRVRVNDRGPYVKKFAIDLSRAAAHALGVDVAEDRWVDMRIIALPGEEPLPADVVDGPAAPVAEEVGSFR